MYYWVAYDISSHRTRRLAAKGCKQAGLLRLQRSVFAGCASAELLRELEIQLRDLLAPQDRLSILPIDKTAWQRMRLLGDGPDKTALSRKKPVWYF
ncbi:MAG: CRISPR-associated endonuclease Cas2 [Saprospiraceae bacterium]|nr:CRISPR-associated endonuclease Cas2 [Saprospiraceae bacterium]